MLTKEFQKMIAKKSKFVSITKPQLEIRNIFTHEPSENEEIKEPIASQDEMPQNNVKHASKRTKK